VAVRVPRERVEEARAVLVDLFPEGFEESEGGGGEIELAAYTTCGGEERLRALGPVSATPVDAGWGDAWKRFHRPVRVGPLWVGPPWETPDSGSIPVVIDPGRAFGTGAHATTRLCLELLVELRPSSLVDLGCGSGVLAIAAAKLGFAPVVALDSDEAAVEAAQANSAANSTPLDARRADVLADRLPVADVALANIALPVVERLGERLAAGLLVSSGYLVGAEPQLPSWRLLERREAEGWAADLLTRREG
jgi:ribosomal protein L11 methyltransferase